MLVGRDHSDDAHRLRHREVEERASDRIRVANDLSILVRPSGVINQPVD